MAFADDRIALPVANALAGMHHRGPLLNGDLIGDSSTATIGAIAFPSLLLAAQQAIQIASSPFVLVDMLLDPLMTDRQPVFTVQPTSDLLRAPGLLQ